MEKANCYKCGVQIVSVFRWVDTCVDCAAPTLADLNQIINNKAECLAIALNALGTARENDESFEIVRAAIDELFYAKSKRDEARQKAWIEMVESAGKDKE